MVRNAKTVYQIQRKAGKLAAIQVREKTVDFHIADIIKSIAFLQVDSTQLIKWIRDRNRNPVL